MVSGVSLCGQTKKLDRWVLDNAHIGPDSPLEIPAGSTYNARVEYPNPDGPTMQLPATIVWSIAPAVKGINIDRDSGKITVDAGVPSGTTAIVHANVNNGVRKLTAKVFVYSATENPLVGHWTVTSALGCGENQQSLPSEVAGRLTRHWSFYADRKVWIGQPSGIAAGVKLSGTYEFDQRTHTLTLTPTWPKGKAAEKWKLELMSREEIKVASGQPQDDKGQVCGYVLSRNSPIN
ncbi:MAG TPA: hypothetical protein VF532_03455 [Candidatus Angelobacter sp.]